MQEVIKVVSVDSLSASSFTSTMKTIGNGNMLDGAKELFKLGNVTGFIIGVATTCVVIPVGKKVGNFIKEQYNKYVDKKVRNYLDNANFNNNECKIYE